MSTLRTSGLAVGHGRRVLVTGLDLVVEPGTVTCLLGPNGTGKTTLLRTLLGLHPPAEGRVEIDGLDVHSTGRRQLATRLAYVPQTLPLAVVPSVRDLVVAGRTARLGPFGTPSHRDYAAADAALGALGLAPLASRSIGRISGGEHQLALVARALTQAAALVVMDEPTASLDLANRARVLGAVRDLARRGVAVLFSTHEPDQAFAVADTVWLFGRAGFSAGPTDTICTAAALGALYGIPVAVETAPSGRRVVTAALGAADTEQLRDEPGPA